MVDFHMEEVFALTNKSLHIKLIGREGRQEFHLHTTGFESQDLLWSQGPRTGYTMSHHLTHTSHALTLHNFVLSLQVPTLFLLFAEWYTSIVFDEI
jgi:hypothetical protein